MHSITESTLKQTTLSWFEKLRYQSFHGSDIAPSELQAERDSCSEMSFKESLKQAKAGLSL